MLLNFKSQFVPFIASGEKRHTIRSTRKIAPRVGETCHLYTGLRKKGAKLLGRYPCVKVEQIEIRGGWETLSGDFLGDIAINGVFLNQDEKESLAKRDGFASFTTMIEFWRGRLPFEGQIIHWDFNWKDAALCEDPAVTSLRS